MASTTHPTSYTTLFQKVNTGDQTARDELFFILRSQLERLTRAMVRSFPLALKKNSVEDIQQELNLRLLRAMEAGLKPEGMSALMGFAAMRLRNFLSDEAGKERRRHRDEHGQPRPDFPLAAGGANSEAAGHLEPGTTTYNPVNLEMWTEFHDRVKELPDDERIVFDLHFFQQMLQVEIAELLGLHVREVSRRWIKATIKLSPHLPKFDPPK
jgi:RNA polymerase sigma factor (sigma-70 family)